MPPKKLRKEPHKVKDPNIPSCPRHQQPMAFEAARGVWLCSTPACNQVAFPPDSVSEGKPILGSGQLELVLMKDPEGGRLPRVLLRTIEGRTVVLDVTDNATGMEVNREPMEIPGMNPQQVMAPGPTLVKLSLEFHAYLDAR